MKSLLLFLVSSTLLGANPPLVYDLNRDKFSPVDQTRPSRLYGVYDLRLKRYVLSVTDEKGKFSDPLESFLTGSIVRGAILGSDDNKLYRLSQGQKWVPDEKASTEKYLFHVSAEQPFNRTIEFKKKSKSAQRK